LMKPLQSQRHRFVGLGGGEHAAQNRCDDGRNQTVKHDRCPPHDDPYPKMIPFERAQLEAKTGYTERKNSSLPDHAA
jgi:hypothetical protein